MAELLPAISYVLQNEGGFQNNPNDVGNYDNAGNLIGTNWGISAKRARNAGYLGPMEDMSQEEALAIYEAGEWRGLEMIENQAVATKILDLRVQFGISGGIVVAQKAANQYEGVNLAVDGRLGPLTLEAINSIDPASYLDSLREEAEARYLDSVQKRPENAEFLSGWLARARRMPDMLMQTIIENPGTSSAVLLGTVALAFFLANRK